MRLLVGRAKDAILTLKGNSMDFLKLLLLVGLPVSGTIAFYLGHKKSVATGNAWDAPSLEFGAIVLGFLCCLAVAAVLVSVVL